MRKENVPKNDKQIFHKWLLLMAAALLIGGIVGAFSVPISKAVLGFLSQISVNRTILAVVVLAVFAAANIAAYTYGFLQYGKAKKFVAVWDGEDEDIFEEAETCLDYALITSSMMSVCNYFFFALNFYVCDILGEDSSLSRLGLASIGILIFFVAMILQVVLQKKVIDMEKALNPEKQGNVFDKNFSKDWEASCDEAQQLMIYKASYSAYKTAATVCQVMWGISIFGMILFDTGILAVFCVTVIMGAMMLSYYRACIKLEGRHKI